MIKPTIFKYSTAKEGGGTVIDISLPLFSVLQTLL